MIQIQNAGFKIDGKTILNDLSFILPEGESMAIVGPSGCGKTTLGRLISGRTGLTSGRIQFANGKLCLMVEQQDSFMAASHMRSGYYSQRFENQEMDGVPTVRAYLQIIAKSFKTEASQSTIDKHLQRFDMLAISDRKLMQLSDGERKRLQLIEPYFRIRIFWFLINRLLASIFYREKNSKSTSFNFRNQEKRSY